jgi:hypothetical protein
MVVGSRLKDLLGPATRVKEKRKKEWLVLIELSMYVLSPGERLGRCRQPPQL